MSVVIPTDPLPADPDGQQDGANSPAAAIPEQIRLSIHVGRYHVDSSVSAHAPLRVVMEGLVPFLADTLRSEGLTVEVSATGIYSLAVEGGLPLALTQTLAEAGILDGSRLVLREVHSTEVFKPIIEDGSDALAEFNAVKFPAFTAGTARHLGLTAVVAGSVLVAALITAAWWSVPSMQWWLPPSAAAMFIAVGGAVVAARRGAPAVSYAVGIAALPQAFAAGWVTVPAYDGVAGNWTSANVFAGIFAVGILSLMVLWLTGIGITVHTAVIALSAVATTAAGFFTFTGFDHRQIGTVAVVIGMIMVAVAPGLALTLARVRPPSLPVPGEDIDRTELDDAAMVVEMFDDGNDVHTVALSDDEDTQLERRSRVSNKYLTGLFTAAVITIVVGAVAAVEPGTHYFYGEVAVAVLSILILVLRGRSLTDRVHAVTFFLAAFLLLSGFTLTVVANTANPVADISVIGGVFVLTVLSVLAGTLLPGVKMSPITLRRIEQLEFVAILAIVPLALWIISAYAFFRNLL